MYMLIDSSFSDTKLVEENKKVVVYNIEFKDKESFKNYLNDIKKNNNSRKKALFITNFDLKPELRGLISSAKTDFDLILIKGGSNKKNRYIIEQLSVDFIVDPHISEESRFDFIHHYNSGLNHVLTKLANEKNIGVLTTLNSLVYKNKIFISKDIGRISQNVKLCRKYGALFSSQFIIKNKLEFRSLKELMAIGTLYNMSTQQLKDSISAIENKINENLNKTNKHYIDKGIVLEQTF